MQIRKQDDSQVSMITKTRQQEDSRMNISNSFNNLIYENVSYTKIYVTSTHTHTQETVEGWIIFQNSPLSLTILINMQTKMIPV